MHKDLSQLFKEINQDKLVDDLKQLIAIPSINPFQSEPRKDYREKEVGEYYCDRMSDLGLEVGSMDVVPGRPNVWGTLKGSGDGPSLMLSGHLDTVGIENYDDALKPRVEGGRVYGRGACDMKDALASYLEVIRLVRDSGEKLNGDLIITGIADEEDQMLGSKHLGQHGPWADFAVIGEPTGMAICPAHKGQLGVMIKTHGKAAHSSKPENGANAIEAMALFMQAYKQYQDQLMAREEHALCGHPRCSAGVIKGGSIVSTVPDYCELEVDRRTLPGESSEQIVKEYQQILDELSQSNPQFQYELCGPTLDVEALDVPLDSPLVEAIASVYKSVTGKQEIIEAFPGSTDAPNFGFPALIFGSGDLVQAHTINEYVEIDEMVEATKVYLGVIWEMLASKSS